MSEKFKDKIVMVTGSCGTVGSELVRQLLNKPIKHLICIDNNETELFFQYEKFSYTNKISCYLADIRDLDALKLRMDGVDIVLHSAALKHVGLCEDSPSQAIETNVRGIKNIIDAAIFNKVERIIFTSSDKAVNPTNVMGATKLIGERLMTSAAESIHKKNSFKTNSSHQVFASTRFGNVLGSRGSVIPLFKKQIKAGGPITLTDPEMTRFIMTLEESVRLVLDSVWLANGGEVMVTKMPVARIEDISNIMKKILSPDKNIDINIIGSKPGEKMYEELMSEEEVKRSYEYGDYFIVLPNFARVSESSYGYLLNAENPNRPYNSRFEKFLSESELLEFFKVNHVI